MYLILIRNLYNHTIVQDVPVTYGCQPTGTCESRCGSGSDQDCWCDDLCVTRGDCCCDIQNFCHLESVSRTNTTTSAPDSEVFTLRPSQEGLAVDNSTSSTSLSSENTTDAASDSTLTFDLASSTASDPHCRCRTNEDGPVIGGCCQFPFIYAGVEHHTCIEVGGCQSWCATELDTQGHYIPDMWGFCDDTCHWDTPTPLPVTEATLVSEKDVTISFTGNTTTTTASIQHSHASESTLEESLSSSSTESSSVSEEPTTVISESSTRKPFKFKPSDDFIKNLPPDHSLVVIHEDLHDPVRVSTLKIFSSYTLSSLYRHL